MTELDVLKTQWIILAVAAGLVLALVVVLTYLMMWRPRRDGAPATGWRGIWQHTPWVLVLTIVGITIYALIATVRAVFWPPNW
jgi:hypothetical protein